MKQLAQNPHSDEAWFATATDLAKTWYDRFNRGDVEGAMSTCVDNYIHRSPDGTIYSNKADIQKMIQASADAGIKMNGNPVEPVASGLLDKNSAWALYKYITQDAEGTILGTYEAVWMNHLEDGEWKAYGAHIYDTTPTSTVE